jgi:hypothetical protein
MAGSAVETGLFADELGLVSALLTHGLASRALMGASLGLTLRASVEAALAVDGSRGVHCGWLSAVQQGCAGWPGLCSNAAAVVVCELLAGSCEVGLQGEGGAGGCSFGGVMALF